jgi:transcriptional regulator with XRE-family HTH domain
MTIQQIKAQLKSLCLTQSALANALNFSQSSISNALRGKNAKVLAKIEKYLASMTENSVSVSAVQSTFDEQGEVEQPFDQEAYDAFEELKDLAIEPEPQPAQVFGYQRIEICKFTYESLELCIKADSAKVKQIVDAALQLGTLIAPIVVKFAGIENGLDRFDVIWGVEALAAALDLYHIDSLRFETVGVTVVPVNAPVEAVEGQMFGVNQPNSEQCSESINRTPNVEAVHAVDPAPISPLQRIAEAIAVVAAYLSTGCLWADAGNLATRAMDAILNPLYRAIYQAEGSRRVWLRKCKRLVAAV